jgi:hypothetical protein
MSTGTALENALRLAEGYRRKEYNLNPDFFVDKL